MRTQRVQQESPASDLVGRFFDNLGVAGHIPTFERESASLRFDIADGKDVRHWFVMVADGEVTVTNRDKKADAIVRLQRPHAEALVTGRLNAQAGYLRGVLDCEGDMAALMMFQRCLPGPPGSTGRIDPISSQAVTSQRRDV